jgi:hypothetical protein
MRKRREKRLFTRNRKVCSECPPSCRRSMKRVIEAQKWGGSRRDSADRPSAFDVQV